MEWNLKAAASWDFSTLDDEEAVAFANMNTDGGVGSTSGLGTNKVGFSVDLKLGQVVDLGKDGKDGEGLIKMTSSTSPSGSSKRARGGGNNAGQAVSCLVDGCYSDLSHCRDYHRRHKVCELHSKTPEAIISGHQQRFCQQCSRFHSLDEFDEGKRSCRKRLDGHNRRRRKPQLDPLSRTGPILPHYQGSQMLPFSNSHVYPSTKVVNHAWPGVVNSEGNLKQQINLFDKQKYILGSSPGVSSCYKVGQQLTFLQVDNPRPNDHQSAVGQAAPMKTIAFPENDGENSSKMLYERSSRFARPIPEADCALSLLSSTQTQTQSSGIGLSLLDTIDSAQVSSISSASADVSLSGMFYHHLGYDAGGGNLSPPPPPPTLPFHWE